MPNAFLACGGVMGVSWAAPKAALAVVGGAAAAFPKGFSVNVRRCWTGWGLHACNAQADRGNQPADMGV